MGAADIRSVGSFARDRLVELAENNKRLVRSRPIPSENCNVLVALSDTNERIRFTGLLDSDEFCVVKENSTSLGTK